MEMEKVQGRALDIFKLFPLPRGPLSITTRGPGRTGEGHTSGTRSTRGDVQVDGIGPDLGPTWGPEVTELSA